MDINKVVCSKNKQTKNENENPILATSAFRGRCRTVCAVLAL